MKLKNKPSNAMIFPSLPFPSLPFPSIHSWCPLVIVLVACLITPENGNAQDGTIVGVDRILAPESVAPTLDRIEWDEDTRDVKLLSVDGDIEKVLRQRQFDLMLPIAGQVTFITKGFQMHRGGIFEWQGRVGGMPAFMVVGEGTISASFSVNSDRYDILPTSEGYAVLRRQLNDLTFVDDTPRPRFLRHNELPVRKSGSMSGSNQVDVLFIYANGVTGAATLAAQAASQTNSAISNTDFADGSVNVVGVVRYPELPNNDAAQDILDHMENDSSIEVLRSAYGADVVAAIAEISDSYSGMVTDIYPGSSNTYLVADPDKIVQTGRYTFVHEVTHLLGGRHNVSADATSTPWAYGHGFYRYGTVEFASIMNVEQTSQRNLVFSTPDDGNIDGPYGSESYENVARVWDEVAWTVAGYKNPTTAPSGDLLVSIYGPSEQKKTDTCEFSASAYYEHGLDIPCDNCTFSWFSRPYVGGTWSSLGVTTQTIYYELDNPTGKQLRVDVTSSSDSASDTFVITGNPSASCGGGGARIVPIDFGDESTTNIGTKKRLHVDLYPNPFNPTTQIRLDNPRQQAVLVELYDLHGRLVTVLNNSYLDEGIHTISWTAADQPSGVYLARIKTPSDLLTVRLSLLK